ncbi:ammonium transporter [Magnetospirillum sp. UT-4]|uniref:ammonium transporter n=1 Tax=Magnetospirillum sp. UT-4 TaxID=2681467 RepID=UPI001385FA6C|nr:ammonium transporter [Magnetospirillum sp. UT-4]CAA7613511.1 Ammonium transporter [Magnetospirillum sp. UT-4]
MSPSDALSPHIAWVLMASFLVALMQAGFTCLESGFVRAKNSINVAIKNLVDFCISSILFTLFGYQLMYGASVGGWFGLPVLVRYEGMNPGDITYFIFQLMFCGTAATIISGAVSERMRFVGYALVTVVTAGVIYPLVGHWVWNGAAQGTLQGWLGRMGFVDFAGSTVVHSVGGWVSLAAVLVIGPRLGRFGPTGHRIEGHNLPMSVLGVFLLWFGFFGFNAGSTLALNQEVPLIVANTALAGAAGGMAGLGLSWWGRKHPTVDGIVNGVIAGLVAICASCNAVGELDSIAIGLVAGLLAVVGIWVLELVEVDDVMGVVPAHLFAGIWGTLAFALFADPARLPAGDRFAQFGVQALGVVAVGLFVLPLCWGLFRLIDRWMPFRVTPEQERIGLNVAEHNATTSILELVTQMDWQARTGDFSRKVAVELETEAAEIARYYNAVLDKFMVETERRQQALERLNQLATTDPLTGLPNRRAFFDQVRRGLAAARRTGRDGAVMYLDLDGFKAVNDSMGHEAGDALLRQVAARLSKVLRETDMLARLGGDEFALLLAEIHAPADAEHVAEKLVEVLHEPFDLPQGTALIGVSVGVAMFGQGDPHDDVEAVVKRADHAMYDAKLAGKGTWRFGVPA